MRFFRNSIYSAGFWLMCLSSFLFFISFNMLLPELPDYLTRLGGADYKGFIIALFTLTAGISRPFSGKLADTVGRIPVMVFGSLVCFLCGFFYPWVTTVAGFLLLRLLHGFSTGFKPTGTAAFIADIIPLQRRGEAMGLLGVAGSLGMAAGPVVGSLITNQFSLGTMFYCSSGAALLSLAVQGTMTETLPQAQRERFSWRLLRLEWSEVLEPQVRAPAIVTLLCLFPFGIVLTVIPDQSQLLGIANKGLFFTFFTTASLLVRLVAGRASDTYGRVPILRASAALLALSMILLIVANSVSIFLTAAVIFGLAAGLNSPTLYAWTIDLSHEQRQWRLCTSRWRPALDWARCFRAGCTAMLPVICHTYTRWEPLQRWLRWLICYGACGQKSACALPLNADTNLYSRKLGIDAPILHFWLPDYRPLSSTVILAFLRSYA